MKKPTNAELQARIAELIEENRTISTLQAQVHALAKDLAETGKRARDYESTIYIERDRVIVAQKKLEEARDDLRNVSPLVDRLKHDLAYAQGYIAARVGESYPLTPRVESKGAFQPSMSDDMADIIRRESRRS